MCHVLRPKTLDWTWSPKGRGGKGNPQAGATLLAGSADRSLKMHFADSNGNLKIGKLVHPFSAYILRRVFPFFVLNLSFLLLSVFSFNNSSSHSTRLPPLTDHVEFKFPVRRCNLNAHCCHWNRAQISRRWL